MVNDFTIVGGGFFGCYLAYILRRKYPHCKIELLEQDSELMKRASYNNQARIHNGYHYPRCLLTALRSKANFSRFVKEFDGCVYRKFEQYYAVGRAQSKVNAAQFKQYFKRIGVPLKKPRPEIMKYFNKDLIDDVFLVEEYAFDAVKLKGIMEKKLKEKKVPVFLDAQVLKVERTDNNLMLTVKHKRKTMNIESRYVFVCTYSNINTLLENSGIEKIHLKEEMTEMVVVDVPEEFKNIGITVMCGPFFSFMPFPPKHAHTLSHVRYTPHHYWHDKDIKVNNQAYYEYARKHLKTNFQPMVKDAARYVPIISQFKYKESIWEIKTVLPQSENDDGRPILFKRDVGSIKNLICIMGGKIDNVYDIEDELGDIK